MALQGPCPGKATLLCCPLLAQDQKHAIYWDWSAANCEVEGSGLQQHPLSCSQLHFKALSPCLMSLVQQLLQQNSPLPVSTVLFLYLSFVFETGFPLYNSSCPGTHSTDQVSLEFGDLPASASPSDGIKGVCHHARLQLLLLKIF